MKSDSVRGLPTIHESNAKTYAPWSDPGNIIVIDDNCHVTDGFRSWLFNRGYLGSAAHNESTPYRNLRDVSWRRDFRRRCGLTEAALRRGTEYEQWRAAVLKRDDCQCRKCGTRKQVTAHHIYPLDYVFELAYDLDNGWTLCKKCHEYLHGYGARQRAVVVGWELPKHLARLARHWTVAKHDPSAFSLSLWEWGQPSKSPVLWARKVGTGFSIRSSRVRYKHDQYQPPEYVDLWTLAYAQTGKKLTLAQALDVYGAQDSTTLANAMLDEHARHPVALRPSQAFSVASYVKAYLRAMNVAPPMTKYQGPREYLDYAERANYGARNELFIRQEAVPVHYLDFKSQYAAVTTLMRLTELLTAKRIEVHDATSIAKQLLETLTLEDCFNPELWPLFSIYCEVVPDDELLPVRDQFREFSKREHVALAHFTSATPRFYCIADLIASKLLTGKLPRINWAFQFCGIGTQKGLTSVELCGDVDMHPSDMFRTIVEARQQYAKGTRMNQFLKTMVASGGFGIFGEINQEKGQETAGEWFFPGISSAVTAGGRLLLAMLEACVNEAEGLTVYVDTDAAMIFGEGDWDVTNSIVARFEQLKPFRIDTPFLEIEPENYRDGKLTPLWFWGSACKCYALFNHTDNGIEIRKASRNGISQYAAPVEKPEYPIWLSVITDSYLDWMRAPAVRVTPYNSPRMYERAELPFGDVRTIDSGIATPEFTWFDLIGQLRSRYEPTMVGNTGLLSRRRMHSDEPPRVIGKEGHSVAELTTGQKVRLTYRSCGFCGRQLTGKQRRWCAECQDSGRKAVARRAPGDVA